MRTSHRSVQHFLQAESMHRLSGGMLSWIISPNRPSSPNLCRLHASGGFTTTGFCGSTRWLFIATCDHQIRFASLRTKGNVIPLPSGSWNGQTGRAFFLPSGAFLFPPQAWCIRRSIQPKTEWRLTGKGHLCHFGAIHAYIQADRPRRLPFQMDDLPSSPTGFGPLGNPPAAIFAGI